MSRFRTRSFSLYVCLSVSLFLCLSVSPISLRLSLSVRLCPSVSVCLRCLYYNLKASVGSVRLTVNEWNCYKVVGRWPKMRLKLLVFAPNSYSYATRLLM